MTQQNDKQAKREPRDQIKWLRLTMTEVKTLEEMMYVYRRTSMADLLGSIVAQAIAQYKHLKDPMKERPTSGKS